MCSNLTIFEIVKLALLNAEKHTAKTGAHLAFHI